MGTDNISRLKELSSLLEAQERTETMRREKEILLLMNAVSDMVLVMDDHNIVRYANPSTFRVLGFYPEELVTKDISSIITVPETGVSPIVGNSIRVLAATKDGCSIPVAMYIGELKDADFHLFVIIIRKAYRDTENK